MKNYRLRCLIPAMSLLTLAACDRAAVGTESDSAADSGTIRFECSVSERVSVPRIGQISLPEYALPDPQAVALTITGGTDEEPVELHYDSMAQYDKPLLKEGDYSAAFRYGDPATQGNEMACFGGAVDFTIVARTTVTQSVTLTLVNSVMNLRTSEWFRNYYQEYTLTLRTDSGVELTFTGNAEEPLTTTGAQFVAAGSKVRFSGSAVKTNGREVQFPQTEICTTKPQTWHTIDIDAGEAAEGAISVTLDDTIIKVSESEIEINPEA